MSDLGFRYLHPVERELLEHRNQWVLKFTSAEEMIESHINNIIDTSLLTDDSDVT